MALSILQQWTIEIRENGFPFVKTGPSNVLKKDRKKLINILEEGIDVNEALTSTVDEE